MGEYEDIVLEGGRPWGIRIQGGRGSSFPLRLAQITPESKAAFNGLRAGMHILEINGRVCNGLTMQESQDLVKCSGNTLKLRIKDPAKINVSGVKNVVIEGGRPFGLRLMGGKDMNKRLKVGVVTPGSKAAAAGIQDGDLVFTINNINTEQLTRTEAENLVRETGDSLKLGIRSTVEQPSPLPHSPPGKLSEEVEEAFTRDPAFVNELRQSVAQGRKSSEIQEAKGNTFVMMKDHLDAGIGQNVLTVFDVDPSKRNQSIPTTAPKVNKQDSLDGGEKSAGLTRTVVLSGGNPWGLRIKGGAQCGAPLAIASVTTGSKAYNQGLLTDDHILSINDVSLVGFTMMESQELIKNTGDEMKLVIKKPGIKRLEEGVDERFMEDLKISMVAGNKDRSGRDVKGNAFKKLQSIVDAPSQ